MRPFVHSSIDTIHNWPSIHQWIVAFFVTSQHGIDPMADLTQSLRKKRAELITEQDELTVTLQKTQQRLADVNSAITGIDAVLKLDEPANASSGGANSNGDDQSKDLQTILFAALADRCPHSTSELVEVANRQGFDFQGKSPLRTVGFTLLGTKKGGRVLRTQDGQWRLANHQ